MSICIIGAGWYGCYIAEYLLDNFKNLEITIIEKDNCIFNNSSYKNQNRLHIGFHYPRCQITRNKCKINFSKFIDKYNVLTEKLNHNYYVISNESNIDYNDYLNLYDKLDFQISDNIYNFNNIQQNKLIKTNERHINFKLAKLYFSNKLTNKNNNIIKFKYNYTCTTIENINNYVIINNELKFDKVFNCTYNNIQTTDNIIYEKCLTLLYKKTTNIELNGLTIMDGPFCSLYKYDNNIYTLTDVELTPIIKTINLNNLNTNIIEEQSKLIEYIKHFEMKILKYYPDFNKNFEYYNFFESIKCKNINTNDSRDINLSINKNIFNIWCGKISFIFELDSQINTFFSEYSNLVL